MVPSAILKTRECICLPKLHEKLYTITYSLNNIQGVDKTVPHPQYKITYKYLVLFRQAFMTWMIIQVINDLTMLMNF
jgi:hypothetical protein